MDLSLLNTQKAAETTFAFEPTHPVNGKALGFTLHIYGAESNAVKAYRNRIYQKMQKQEFENSRLRKPKLQDVDELECVLIEGALVRLAGWENVEWEKKPLEFTTENARKVLTACPWLCGQITEQSDDLGNFLKG